MGLSTDLLSAYERSARESRGKYLQVLAGDFLSIITELTGSRPDAKRYRALREALSSGDEDFLQAMAEAMPDEVNDGKRGARSTETDAAVDAASKNRVNKLTEE